MARSLSAEAMRAASLAAGDLGLRVAGFRRQGLHWHRWVGSMVHGVHMQAGRASSRDYAEFTVNLHVSWPVIAEAWLQAPFPKNPATMNLPVGVRLGDCMPQAEDTWWQATSDTDLDALGHEIGVAIVTHGLSFFEHYPDTATVLDALAEGDLPGLGFTDRTMTWGILAADAGDLEAAARAFQQTYREAAGFEGFAQTVRDVAQLVGVRASLEA